MIIEDCTIFLFKRKTFVIYVKIQVWEWIGNHWSRWKRGWNSVGERRVRIRDAKISQSGIGRSGWPRDLYEVIRGTSFATWQPFLRARELSNFLAGHAMENAAPSSSRSFSTPFEETSSFRFGGNFEKFPLQRRERDLFSRILSKFSKVLPFHRDRERNEAE